MPIKPENRHRYPADWKDIRQRILTRAGYRCEWPGCRARHHLAYDRDHHRRSAQLRRRDVRSMDMFAARAAQEG